VESEKSKILIAEDEPDLLSIMDGLLSPHFDVVLAKDGFEAKKLIESHNFLFLILDIHLPDLSGLELCQWIIDSDNALKPHIVITSGDNSQSTITAAYELNIDDYIVKPISPLLFVQRMQRLERDVLDHENLESQRNASQNIAQTAMQQASEYGSALELISRLNSITNSQQLAKEVATYMKTKGYYSAVQLRSSDEIVTFDIDFETCTENELRVFKVLHDQGRIFSFGRRSMFNDDHVSLLIKNMPSMDSHSYGFLVDVAAKIIPAINNRFVSLCNESAIATSIDTLSSAIELVSSGLVAMELEKQQILEEIIAHISASFHTLELNEIQESFFVTLIEQKLTQKTVDNKFIHLRDTLDNCLVSVKESQKMSKLAEQAPLADYQDVELF
jgi:DNA-binding response OmpR family regulator